MQSVVKYHHESGVCLNRFRPGLVNGVRIQGGAQGGNFPTIFSIKATEDFCSDDQFNNFRQ